MIFPIFSQYPHSIIIFSSAFSIIYIFGLKWTNIHFFYQNHRFNYPQRKLTFQNPFSLISPAASS